MLDHPLVDVALGLILLYSTLSLVASVVKDFHRPWAAGEEPPEGDSDPHRRGPRRSAVGASPGQHAGEGEEAPVLHRIGHLRLGGRGLAGA